MKKWHFVILAILLAGLIAAFLVYRLVYNKPHTDYEKAEPRYTLDARQLYDAFKNGGKAAASKFNGQVIAISGIIDKTEVSDSLVTAVFVFSQGDFGDEGIRCILLQKFRDPLSKVTPGTPVRIKGYCTGYNGSDVILDKCSLLIP